MTVAGPSETLVMARNGHKSSFAGLVMSGARPVYVDPVYDEDLEIALGPRVEVLKRELAGDGAEERVLLVHGLQGGDAKVGQADRDDDGGESASGANVQDGHGSGLGGCRGGGAEMGHELETIDDVLV